MCSEKKDFVVHLFTQGFSAAPFGQQVDPCYTSTTCFNTLSEAMPCPTWTFSIL